MQLRRLLALVVLVWAIGFGWFAMALPLPAGSERTDAVVVLTGGEGRIGRGLDVVRKGWSRHLLVSGVDREVKPREFALEYRVEPALMACCVTLGFASVDTRSNAAETAQWIKGNKVRSVRLITTDWHMRRAASEFGTRLPPHVLVVRDAVRSRPSLRILVLEYHKLLASWLLGAWQ